MITQEQAEKLISLVIETRAAQNKYFKTRLTPHLVAFLISNRDLDNYLRKLTYEEGLLSYYDKLSVK